MEEKNVSQTNISQNTNQQNQATDDPFADVRQELKTRFELLPTELQDVITSSDYQMKLFEAAKKHKLTYDKLGQLELETTMVLLGMTPPDEYKGDLNEQLGLGGAELDGLVADINEAVFKPIREKLMALYTKEEVEAGEKATTENSKQVTFGIDKDPNRKPVAPVGSDPYRESPFTTTQTTTSPTKPLANTVLPEQKPTPQAPISTPSPATKQEVKQNELLKNIEDQLKNIRERSSTGPANVQTTVPSPKPTAPSASTAPTARISVDLSKIPPPAQASIQTKIEIPPVQSVSPVSPQAVILSETTSEKKSLMGKLTGLFSVPKKPIDTLLKTSEGQKQNTVPTPATPTVPQNPSTPTVDPYREIPN